jgi:hypothetical protein
MIVNRRHELDWSLIKTYPVSLKRTDHLQLAPHPPSKSSIFQTFRPPKQSESEVRERFTPL